MSRAAARRPPPTRKRTAGEGKGGRGGRASGHLNGAERPVSAGSGRGARDGTPLLTPRGWARRRGRSRFPGGCRVLRARWRRRPGRPPPLRWLPQGCRAWPLRGGQGPQEPPTRFLGSCGDGVSVEGLLGLHSQPGAPLLHLWVLLTPPSALPPCPGEVNSPNVMCRG